MSQIEYFMEENISKIWVISKNVKIIIMKKYQTMAVYRPLLS
jgi:hypothetical protein